MPPIPSLLTPMFCIFASFGLCRLGTTALYPERCSIHVGVSPLCGWGFATELFGPGVRTRFWACDDTMKLQQVAELVVLVRRIKLAIARVGKCCTWEKIIPRPSYKS